MKYRFQISYMGELTIFLDYSVKTASTSIETQKPLVKDEEAVDVDVHLYRSMIGSLMYLTASRPNIMFADCTCSRFQVTPKSSHFQAVKRIFRYLKGQPKLGLWYPKASLFDLEAYLGSDYAGANLDKKSITGCCQFLGRRLIAWQCKKQTIVATSITKAEMLMLHTAVDNTGRQELSIAGPTTTPTTLTIFDDEEITLADTLIKLKDNKAKGVAFKDSKSTDRPARSIVTLKPLPTIDPKDKGKSVMEEHESAKKMSKSDFDAAKIARDEEIARKIDVDHELAVRWTHEEHEKYTVNERAKLLAEYFQRRKKQFAEERAAANRNKPPTKTQLRRSEEDERMIRDMNKKAKEESNDKGIDNTKKRKEGSKMKRMSKRQTTDVDLEE
nr:hypothetical protein [Tanacetum cinerariifolium]